MIRDGSRWVLRPLGWQTRDQEPPILPSTEPGGEVAVSATFIPYPR